MQLLSSPGGPLLNSHTNEPLLSLERAKCHWPAGCREGDIAPHRRQMLEPEPTERDKTTTQSSSTNPRAVSPRTLTAHDKARTQFLCLGAKPLGTHAGTHNPTPPPSPSLSLSCHAMRMWTWTMSIIVCTFFFFALAEAQELHSVKEDGRADIGFLDDVTSHST